MTIGILDKDGNPQTIPTVDDLIRVPSKATFTRPADTNAYSGPTSTSSGDLVANSTTAGSVVPMSFTGATISGAGGQGRITKVVVIKDGTAQTTFRVHFFTASPTMTNGDNGAFVVTTMNLDNYIGHVDVTLDGGVNGGASGGITCSLDYSLASGDTIYALLETRAAYTPTSASSHSVKVAFNRF